MSNVRLLITALATICVLALGVFAIVNRHAQTDPGDDVIIIKGGSLTVQCPPNQGKACLGIADITTGKYKHNKNDAHIMKVVVKDSYGATIYSNSFDAKTQPQIELTYK